MNMTIHVETAGTLPALIAESDKYEITELTVTGKLNEVDINYINRMANKKLAILDLSGASIINEMIIRNYFTYCKSLTCITIPNNVTSIERFDFKECSSLKEFIVQEDCQYFSVIDGVLFNKDKTSLIRYPLAKSDTSYIIPNNVASIEMDAFRDCVNLTSITIPDSVTTIGESAFEGCRDLKEFIVMEENMNFSVIDGVLFNKERTIIICFPINKTCASYVVPNSVTSIGRCAFKYCEFLTSITIPDSVAIIEKEAFHYCVGLIHITIPDSVTNIEDEAFCSCVNLPDIIIPDSVTSIGHSVFYRCKNLKNITTTKSVTDFGTAVFRSCESLTNITIPGGVTYLGMTFVGCHSLTHITIPNGLRLIMSDAFEDCKGIKEIHNNAPIPQTGKIYFNDVDTETCKLFVPKGSYRAYKNAKGWNEFINIIEE